MVDDRRILSLVKKTPFTTVGQIKNTLQEVGVCVSKSTIKRRLHQSEYRGFTTRCKPLVSLKNRKARLEFAKRHLKSLHSSGTTSYGQMRPRSTCTRVMGREEWRRKGTAHDPKHTTSSVKHGGGRSWRGHVWLPVELVLLYLLMMWLLKSSRMNSEVFRAIICSYSSNVRTHWTALHSADGQWPKAYCKSNQRVFEGKEWTVCNGQVITWPESDCEHAFHLLKTNWRENAPRTSRNWRRLQ